MQHLASLPDLWHLFMIFQAFTSALDVSGANKHKLEVISLSYKTPWTGLGGKKCWEHLVLQGRELWFLWRKSSCVTVYSPQDPDSPPRWWITACCVSSQTFTLRCVKHIALFDAQRTSLRCDASWQKIIHNYVQAPIKMIHKNRSWANKFIICFPILFFCPSGKMSSQKGEKRKKMQMCSLLCGKVLPCNGGHAEEWRAQNS